MRLRAQRPGGAAMPVAAALLVLLLTACGGDGGGEPTTTAAAPTTTEAAPGPETTAPETRTGTETQPEAAPQGPPFSTERSRGQASDPGAPTPLLADVRISSRPGFDRIVFEFRPGALPAYQVDWARPPIVTNPGGATVSIAGEAFLAVRMEPAFSVDPAGDPAEAYRGPLRLSGGDAGARVVADLVRTEDFQTVLTWVAGLQQETPFRAFTRQGPPRVLVDVRTGG